MPVFYCSFFFFNSFILLVILHEADRVFAEEPTDSSEDIDGLVTVWYLLHSHLPPLF